MNTLRFGLGWLLEDVAVRLGSLADRLERFRDRLFSVAYRAMERGRPGHLKNT